MSVNIMIVDDSVTIRMMIKKALYISLGDELGQVYEANDGISALAQIADNNMDLLMIDLNMPRMNGVQLISRLKTNPKYSEIPIVVISTEGSEQRIKELEEMGISGYIRKPFRPEQIREILSNILEVCYESQSADDDGCDF